MIMMVLPTMIKTKALARMIIVVIIQALLKIFFNCKTNFQNEANMLFRNNILIFHFSKYLVELFVKFGLAVTFSIIA